ncbi:E3 ubiquitin-protein ligase CIP8-like isoform X2 [Phalaenopsis equestris]|uniref:E3 ubiquitin-protein ligase CIP8-like isoform X2 n=1 Tax=Phalaenopsis equestris TaxID=78828 RepID=UPI0009E43E8E|nr:E3 ubiquitin-protein ligase CIP8-like isoform X2 [Phalaenopsis equestris]
MADAIARYWCHMCLQMVNPVMVLELKCPFCDSGFVEEMGGREVPRTEAIGSERILTPWASILLELIGDPSNHPRGQRNSTIDGEDDSDLERELESILSRRQTEVEVDNMRIRREEEEEESETERELQSILRRRRRSTAIRQLLRSLREDFRSESHETESEIDIEWDWENENLVLIDSSYQEIILQGSIDSGQNQNQDSDNTAFGASIGDYFIGSRVDLLLQHLAENDPNRYGTPPAKKEAVDGMPVVKIEEKMSCSVCLEDFEIGMEVRETPCKHKFHGECIVPWLQLHSSCPLCRFQLPADETRSSNEAADGNRIEGFGRDGRVRRRRNRSVTLVPWPAEDELFFSENSCVV